ncbi:hypothetical protein GCM10008018_60490 [Paenibacillus marchantiophytorum]|uniref:Uncharacterized protein n=1 Tax=Paenibacillus marchantiophytorum TaxID=1619310 RepID=A0ABQ1FD18_9BACL|nr:hypothetical protein [Paenibacillus marchantiophytorum]GGA06526.1 hypothetical protein GCM10008018_60490 [Paenibacillus marchantiophytorum]
MDNAQAQAYATLALRDLGFDRETIIKVRSKMYHLFDMKSESEAEETASQYLREDTQ